MRKSGLDEAQDGIKTAGRNTNDLRYADDTTLMAESEEELKSLLMKGKEESEKLGLNLNVQKLRSWHPAPSLHGKQVGKQRQTLFFGGSKITADGDCSHEIKRCLLLGRKVMTKLYNILKSRDIALLPKVNLAKAIVFPIVMYGCEIWTIKKAECRRIDAFELWWRRLFRVP